MVVRMERLELSQGNLLEPKSSASTSSATFAINEQSIVIICYPYIKLLFIATYVQSNSH